MKTWYAVMMNREDNDWGTGSTRKRDAIRMARRYRRDGNEDAYIAVIDESGNEPTCIDEIIEF